VSLVDNIDLVLAAAGCAGTATAAAVSHRICLMVPLLQCFDGCITYSIAGATAHYRNRKLWQDILTSIMLYTGWSGCL